MKKFTLFGLSICLTLLAGAETLKMKNGTLISGSILSQTEYTLNLATSYGNITLNQREIEQILPDKHRLILKGGSQLVGIILDMDEFNLKLQTDDGSIVHVDMPQIVTIEPYDYDRGQNAQQEFVEKQIAHEQQVAQQAALDQQIKTTGQVEAAGGLTFDSDIEQVFEAKKATVVNGQVQTPSAQVQVAAPRPMSDEEAFLKGVKSGAISQQEYAAAAKQELNAKKKKSSKAPATQRTEKNFSKYLAIQVGAMPLDLKANTISANSVTWDLTDNALDLGGTGAAVSGKFLWRIKESNLWLGPTLGFSNIAGNSFSLEQSGTTLEAKSNGSILSLGVAGNYYLNPKSRFVCYLTAAGVYEMLSLNYHGEISSPSSTAATSFNNSISNNGLAASAGIGVETWIDDLMLGLEVRQVFSPRKKELKESASSNTVIQIQLTWKF